MTWPYASGARDDRWRAGEVEALVAVLRAQGPLSARELRRAAAARFWGPGRFGAALRDAHRHGAIRREGRHYRAS